MKSALPSFRTRRKWLALLVLPGLLFRALVPVGFMPMMDFGGGLTIGFCPGDGGLPLTLGQSMLTQHPAAHHHHHAGDGVDSNGSSQHHAPCLFAASAGAGPLPSVLAVVAANVHNERVDVGHVDSVFLPAIVRTQTPRGPPVLS